jgi:hypothetical protein
MNLKKLQQAIADTLDTAEGLINDVIINVRSDEESKCYNRRLKQLYRVKALLLAAPELLAEALSRLQALEVCEEETRVLSCYFFEDSPDLIYTNTRLINNIEAVLGHKVKA